MSADGRLSHLENSACPGCGTLTLELAALGGLCAACAAAGRVGQAKGTVQLGWELGPAQMPGQLSIEGDGDD